MTITNTTSAMRQSTSIVSREGDSLHGPRLVTDEASPLCVRAFAFAEITNAIAAGGLNTPGAYLLLGKESLEDLTRVGESGNVARRLQEHAGDPGMAFAREVFVLTGLDRKLDKQAVVHFQKRLSEQVLSAGAARLIQGVAPYSADLPPSRIASLDRMFADALPLFYDAGCRCLTPPLPVPAAALAKLAEVTAAPTLAPGAEIAPEADEADEGPMEVGVTTVPVGVEELALSFCDLWARGYEHQDRFVVAAGSEMRMVANPSANEHTVTRRNRLIETGTAKGVDGVDDRYRLQVAVAFPSRAIAAKVLCGAHVGSEKWRPLCTPRPYVIAS
jgi:hypothetical protein